MSEHAHTASEQGNLPDLHIDRYEGWWIRISLIIITIFATAVAISSFAWGIQLPGYYQRIDPQTLNDPSSPFARGACWPSGSARPDRRPATSPES